MKLTFIVISVFSAILVNGQQIVNGSFETGDFTGWTVTIPTGISEFDSSGNPNPTVMPAGTANVVSSWAWGIPPSTITPIAGNYFAMIGSATTAYFTANATYDIMASQGVTLRAGQTISGDALFYNGDDIAQDTAFVRIVGVGNSLIATPWSETSGGATFHTATPWTGWEWQAPGSGTYTLEIGVQTGGDDTFASYGMFDNISVKPPGFTGTEVPEPSTVSVAVIGLVVVACGLTLIRNKKP